MNKSTKPIAIIPARGGSKRLPRKNVLPLQGKPLIAWTIEAAIQSGIFERVIVNTDDDEIAAVAKQYGAQVPFMRPAVLATDTTTSIAVLKHQLEYHQAQGECYHDMVLLQPTSPLRTAVDIQTAWQMYCEQQVESLVSVTAVEHPIQWTFVDDEHGLISPLFDQVLKRSQDCEQHYRLNGAIYITRTEHVLCEEQLLHPSSCLSYKMPTERSIDIDTEFDFVMAQAVIHYYEKLTE